MKYLKKLIIYIQYLLMLGFVGGVVGFIATQVQIAFPMLPKLPIAIVSYLISVYVGFVSAWYDEARIEDHLLQLNGMED